MDVVSVVQLGCPLLLFSLDVSNALVKDALEVFLAKDDTLVVLESVLQVVLEDGPEALDRVELRTVGWQEEEFDVELLGYFSDVLRTV